MEHATLHALQLTGIVITLGGAFFVLALLGPLSARIKGEGAFPFFAALEKNAGRWTAIGAAAAAFAVFLDFFVQVAEVQGLTIFGGVGLPTVIRFIGSTTVGRIAALRMALLLLAAAATKLPARAKWWGVLALGLAAAVCSALVSHAAAQPESNASAIVIHLAHVLAAAAWIGVLIHLLASRERITRAEAPAEVSGIAEIVRRFSPLALGASSLIAVSGVLAAVRYLGSVSAVPTSAYGLTLVVKLALLLPLLVAGWTNFRVVRPALLQLTAQPGARASGELRRGTLQLFGRMLELEVTAGILVIAVAGILGSVSPPFEDSAVLLTAQQSAALVTPDLPTTTLIDPASFYGAAQRTVDDLRYSEFMHNYSGIMVMLLGLAWLVQSLRGTPGKAAARAWPFLMIPFAVFIAVAADPEVFILKQVTYLEALQDPQILEHQIGTLLVLVLIWFGWRDRRRPEEERPLGFILPSLMILGSLLLLGHAHSFLTNTQELTNLINVQHAMIGACGLFAGTARWLELRALLPERVARFLWPGFVISVGVIMTFFYRELV